MINPKLILGFALLSPIRCSIQLSNWTRASVIWSFFSR